MKSKIKSSSFLFLATIILLFVATNSIAQNWEKIYGGPDQEWPGYVQSLSTGFIVVGSTKPSGSNYFDVYLLRLDDNGDTLWTKTFGSSITEKGLSVEQTNDGGFIIGGETTTFITGQEDILLIKTDSLGNVLWSKIHNSIAEISFGSTIQTFDDGFITAATSTLASPTSVDFYLLKTDQNGDTMWSRTFGTILYDFAYDVVQSVDSGFVISGTTHDSTNNMYQLVTYKFDQSGSQVWWHMYATNGNAFGNSIANTSDGGYILGGTLNENFMAAKIDATGNLQWLKEVSQPALNRAQSIVQSSDGGFLLAGYRNDFSTDSQVELMKFDSAGNDSWIKYFGSNNLDEAYSIDVVSSGGFVIAGRSDGFGQNNYNIYVIRSSCNDFPVASVTVVDSSCIGDSLAVELSASPIGTYTWLKNDTVIPGVSSQTIVTTQNAIYTVEVTDVNGCSNISNQINVYLPKPYFHAYPNEVCAGDIVFMDPGNTYLQYFSNFDWDFGDGTTDTGFFAYHAYADTGVYAVTKWVHTSNGSCNSFTDSVRVTTTAIPPVDFNMAVNGNDMLYATACPGDRIDFKPYTYIHLFVPYPPFAASSYHWDFGDGTTDNTRNPIHYYSQIDTFTVTFTVTNHCGISNSTSSTIIIDSGHVATAYFDWIDTDGITRSDVNACEQIVFHGFGGTNHQWDFGDGTNITTTVDSVIHVFATAGDYPIQMAVINGCGNIAFYRDTIHVVNPCTFIEEEEKDSRVRIYPNPFTNTGTIEISESILLNNLTFVIYDVFGREVRKFNVVERQFVINGAEFRSGIYFYELIGGSSILSGKMIVE